MKKKVLIVDDDIVLRSLIKKRFQEHESIFTTLLATDGTEAVKILKEHSVSIVVTDLRMPQMDGFALLAHISKKYPDIPVIVLTAYSAPHLKNRVRATEAVAFIEKPVVVDDLAATILSNLEKESEGGSLQGISVGMFLQLVEMEKKTCTLRVSDKNNVKTGVFFCKDGSLLDARIDNVRGEKAACEILSWDSPSFSIQENCNLGKKSIKKELQALLLDAMRLKDEADEEQPEFSKTKNKHPNQKSQQQKAIETISKDTSWDTMIKTTRDLGRLIEAGQLKSCYLENNKNNIRQVLLPEEESTMVVTLKENCSATVIRKLLYESDEKVNPNNS